VTAKPKSCLHYLIISKSSNVQSFYHNNAITHKPDSKELCKTQNRARESREKNADFLGISGISKGEITKRKIRDFFFLYSKKTLKIAKSSLKIRNLERGGEERK
jgi:hypothetical protein